MHVLWANRGKLCSVSHFLPRPRSFWWLKTTVSDWCCGIGDAKVLFHGTQNLIVKIFFNPAQLSVVCGDSGIFGAGINALTRCQGDPKCQQEESNCMGGLPIAGMAQIAFAGMGQIHDLSCFFLLHFAGLLTSTLLCHG